MNVRTDPSAATPIPNAMRERWTAPVLRTCLLHAESLKIIDSRPSEDCTDLNLIPVWLYNGAFQQCQNVIERACRAEQAGYRSDAVLRRLNAELWNYMVLYRQDGYSDFLVTKHQASNA
jgi:hypothetical protein